MCRHYAPRYIGQCAHERAERIQEKKKSNFCTYFRPRPNANLAVEETAEDAARAQLGALFGDAAPEEESDDTPPQAEIAREKLADFFGLEGEPESQSEEEKARQQLGALFGDPVILDADQNADELSNVATSTHKGHNVFVYGTLKRGFPNHQGAMSMAAYIGEVCTLVAFPLVVGGRWFSPYLLDEPGTGQRVNGELFSVDDAGLAMLDELEGLHVVSGYRRIAIAVQAAQDGNVVEAWTYVKRRETIEGIHCEPMREYQIDPRYVVPSKRDSAF